MNLLSFSSQTLKPSKKSGHTSVPIYLLLMLTGQTISVCIEVNKILLRSKSSALLF